LVAVGFLLAAAPARADDADARSLVEKAVKARGGQDKLEKLPAQVVKFKGTFHGMGEGLPMSGEGSRQGSDKQKIDGNVEVNGQKFPFTLVVAGDKGWMKMGDEAKELDKDALAEAKENAYAGWVSTLAPLKDKAFTLATVGEAKVGERAALGVKVSRKGHRDIDLYFDKETGLLLKMETQVKKEGSDQEVTEETLFGDHKDAQGTKQPGKFTINREGKLYMALEATEYQLSDKLDDSTFAKP